MEEIRGNPNAAAAGSRSLTSPVLNPRDIANSILAETTRRIGVQNIGIGSRTGKPDAAGDLADSAAMHLAASCEQYVRLETSVSSRTLRALSNVRPETCVSSRTLCTSSNMRLETSVSSRWFDTLRLAFAFTSPNSTRHQFTAPAPHLTHPPQLSDPDIAWICKILT